MVVNISLGTGLGEIVEQTLQETKGIGIVLNPLHHSHTALVQAVFQELVRGSQLFFGEGNLGQIILTMVRVVGQ